jgi:hypothetical protein
MFSLLFHDIWDDNSRVDSQLFGFEKNNAIFSIIIIFVLNFTQN